MSDRQKALEWWRGLDFLHQIALAGEIFPQLPVEAVLMSSSKIEDIWHLLHDTPMEETI